jgi:hypothetical protein
MQERVAVEDVGELIRESRFVEADRAEDMSSLAGSEGVDARLVSDPRPGRVQSAVEPEAYFVAEEDDSPALGRFFLIAGKRFLIQTSCFSLSARANRFRGRCTENPSLLSTQGTWCCDS